MFERAEIQKLFFGNALRLFTDVEAKKQEEEEASRIFPLSLPQSPRVLSL